MSHELRMPEINSVIVAGNLTRQPTLRKTNSGKSVCELNLAVNRGYKDTKQTSFFGVTVWEKSAEWCCENLTTGSPVLVEGRLETGEYERDGVKQQKTKIVATRVQSLSWGEAKQTAPTKPAPVPDESDDMF